MPDKILFEGTHNPTPQASRRIPIGYAGIEGSEYVEVSELHDQFTADIETALLTKAEANPSWDASTQPTTNDIVIDVAGATLTFGTINGAVLSASNPAIYYIDVAGKAVRYLVTAPVVLSWAPKTEGVYSFYFNSTGGVAVKGMFPTFGTIAPLYRFYYNATAVEINTRAAEFHPNSQSAIEHEWKHNGFGTVYDSGFELIASPLASGSPNASGINTCVSLTGGSNIDDNFKYSIAHTITPARWQQDLGEQTLASITISNAALFKVTYNDASGYLRVLPATRFPFDFTGIIPNFISSTGVRTPVDSGNFFVYFIYALQDDYPGEAIRIRSAVQQFTTIDLARAYYWENNLAFSNTLRDKEIRPLYRLIFEYRTTYSDAVINSVLRETLDIRTARIVTQSVSSATVLDSNVVLSVVPVGSTSTTQAGLNAELWSRTETKYKSLIATTDFATTAASTSTITMVTDKTAVIFPGMAIKFTLSGVVYYAICTAITSNLLTIAGAPLTTTASALTALAYSDLPDATHVETVVVNGAFADATNTAVIENDLLVKGGLTWKRSKAYLVQVGIICTNLDSGTVTTQAQINVKINNAEVLNTNLTVNTTLVNSIVQFNTANYDVNFGEAIELTVPVLAAGTSPNNDALNLTAYLVFVYP